MSGRRGSGVSLIELLVVLTLAAMLAGVAVPAFHDMRRHGAGPGMGRQGHVHHRAEPAGRLRDRARRRVIGAGHTQPAGQAHAEIQALRDAAGARQRRARRHRLRHAGAVQPLRPHAAVLERAGAAGLGRVVAAILDPNPLVAGRGMASWKRPASPSPRACWPSRPTN
jgi:prepilin-type N-terminal cleavage/methylation domain-containing protein